MDPKISKKTQDTLGKIIKKPPLTEKLLSKPPFRFLHDIMTSVIKTTGMMKGLFTDSEMNSENVKDKESKIAFLQKAIDFTIAASGKQLGIKPAKVVAGHEPEKTNEFLQALAAAINANVNNDDIVGKLTGKSSGGSSKKEEKREERREKSADRRKRDEDKKSRDKSTDKERSRDRDERHKDRDEKHRDREEKHKEDRHKDREKDDRHKDRERESRHKSGRSRKEGSKGKNIVTEPDQDGEADKDLDLELDDDDVTDIKSDENCNTPFPTPDITNPALNSTYAVIKPIPRQVSTYCEMKREDHSPSEEPPDVEEVKRRTKRPKAARPRRSHTYDTEEIPDSTSTDDIDLGRNAHEKRQHGRETKLQNESDEIRQGYSKHDSERARMRDRKADKYRGPKTSTPKNSPDRPVKLDGEGGKRREDKANNRSAKYGDISPRKLGQSSKTKSQSVSPGKRNPLDTSDSAKKRTNELNAAAKKRLKKANSSEKRTIVHKEGDDELVFNNQDAEKGREVRKKHRSKSKITESGGDSDRENKSPGKKDKIMYRDSDYAHERVKKKKKRSGDLSGDLDDSSDMRDSDDQYYKKKRPHGADKRRRSSFTSLFDSGSQRREEEGKENDAPSQEMVNGDHNPRREEEGKENDAPSQEMVNGDHNPPTAAPAKMQRPSSAKGSRRRMEAPVTFTEGGGLDSSDDEDVPAQRQEPTLGQDDLPPQVQGRLARPSSARPAPPKRKEDMAQSEPTMRLGSGKPQNLIIDDGKDDDEDEDETFVVEESAPPPVEPTQTSMVNNEEDDDEDHGGLVKKIMETKKEYEQPRETKVERPTISDAQRRKQREAVQREIDKLRGSIQTLTRSANPLGKIMDYVQEDLDSMQKELEKWKAENKEHALALKREKAITDRAIEPLKVQLSEVDQQIKDQLDLIGAVKCNIIRNDQKIEKMLRTIAKS